MNDELQHPKQEYKRINAYSHGPSLLQILSLIIFLSTIALHSIMVHVITSSNKTIFLILLIFHYVLLTFIVIDYLIITISDPADPRVKYSSNYKETENNMKLLIDCEDCMCKVHVYSYHCHTCKRCVEEFDHHCKFVNNCIGRQNYESFFRLLLTLILYNIMQIGQGLWVFFITDENKYQRWIGLALSIVCFIIFALIAYLALFHVYITCCLYKTTLQYIRQDAQQHTNTNSQQIYHQHSNHQKHINSQTYHTQEAIHNNFNYLQQTHKVPLEINLKMNEKGETERETQKAFTKENEKI